MNTSFEKIAEFNEFAKRINVKDFNKDLFIKIYNLKKKISAIMTESKELSETVFVSFGVELDPISRSYDLSERKDKNEIAKKINDIFQDKRDFDLGEHQLFTIDEFYSVVVQKSNFTLSEVEVLISFLVKG